MRKFWNQVCRGRPSGHLRNMWAPLADETLLQAASLHGHLKTLSLSFQPAGCP